MKKILRLVTTSVLTLTLVACGGQSSASSQPSTQSSSTGTTSSSSAYAAVSVISISADSSSLTQVSGATKKVTVTAKFDSAADPATKLEWYVNSVKDSQTGKTFDYTPSAEGEYKIVAKVGSVASNEILVKVGPAGVVPSEFEIGKVEFIDGDTLEIVALGGADVEVSNHEIADTSYYSIKDGKYVIELKKALAQEESITIKMKRDGKEALKTIVYDEQSFIVDASIDAEADGSFLVTKPFYTDLNDENAETITLTWSQENMNAAASPFIYSVTVPEGATAIAGSTGNLNVADEESDPFTQTFKITKDTVAGEYVFTYKLGNKTASAKVVVEEPEKAIDFKQEAVPGETVKFDVVTGVFDGTNFTQDAGIAKEADGSYTITKPYKASVIDAAFQFTAEAENVDILASLNTEANVGIKPNIIKVSLTAPDGTTLMRVNATTSGAQTTAFVTPVQGRDTLSKTVIQKFDSSTPVGKYVYRYEVTESATNTVVLTKEVVINIEAPEAELALTPHMTTEGQALVANADKSVYTISRPRAAGLETQNIQFNAVLSNYDSAKNPAAVLADSYLSGTAIKELLAYKKTAVGPQTIAGQDINTKVGIEMDVAAALESTKQWKKAAAYAASDVVYYQGSFYQAKSAVSADTAWDKTLWDLAQYKAAVYAVDAPVYHDGVAYKVTTATTANDSWDTVKPTAANVLADIAFDSSEAYAANSVVAYSGGLYKANADVAVGAWDATKWTAEVIAADVMYVVDAGANFAKVWEAGVYAVGGRVLRYTSATASEVYAIDVAALSATEDDADKVEGATTEITGSSVALYNSVENRAIPATNVVRYQHFETKEDSYTFYNAFSLDVDSLTATGNYVFTIQIGSLTKVVTIKVEDPVVKVDFYAKDIKKSAGDASILTKTQAAAVAKTSEYTVTCVSNAANACGLYAEVDFLIENMALPTPVAAVPYSLEILTPLKYDTYSDSVAVAAALGSDGHLDSGDLLTKIYTSDDDKTTVDKLDIKNPGDYVVKLTTQGQTKTITIHAVKAASLDVESVYNKTDKQSLTKYGGAYLFNKAAVAAKTLQIAVKDVNLPSGKVYYTTESTGVAAAAKAVALSFVDGVAVIEHQYTPTLVTTPDDGSNDIVIKLYSKADKTVQIGEAAGIKINMLNIDPKVA